MQDLDDFIKEEFADAEKYTKCASSAPDSFSKFTYIELAREELHHAQLLIQLKENQHV